MMNGWFSLSEVPIGPAPVAPLAPLAPCCRRHRPWPWSTGALGILGEAVGKESSQPGNAGFDGGLTPKKLVETYENLCETMKNSWKTLENL